jgi:hypothetical protein
MFIDSFPHVILLLIAHPLTLPHASSPIGYSVPEGAVISLQSKFAMFEEHWPPKIVSTFNGHDVMVVKAKGEFDWRSHADTDDEATAAIKAAI